MNEDVQKVKYSSAFHVAVVRSTKTVVVKNSKIKGLRDFTKTQNMHNSALRYKLDTSRKVLKILIKKDKLVFYEFIFFYTNLKSKTKIEFYKKILIKNIENDRMNLSKIIMEK